jgi:hypothetical protein
VRKRLLIHAGAGKTGSSSIQKFLSANAPALADKGVAIPSGKLKPSRRTGGQHVFAFADLLTDPRGRERLEDALRAVAHAPSDPGTIILSAENLAEKPGAPALFAGLVDEYDVRLLMYVRRQDEFLLSSWQQWFSKTGDDLWAWLMQEVGRRGDWDTYLARWEAVVPADQITVRPYERARLLGQDVVNDFYGWLGLPQPFESWLNPEADANVSVSDAITELVKGNANVYRDKHDADFHKAVLQLSGGDHARKSRQSPITLAQRRAILQRYAEGNQRVQEQYLPDSPALFTMPRERDVDHVSQEQMRAEQLSFLTTMLWALEERNDPES